MRASIALFLGSVCAWAQNPSVTVNIDINLNRRPINPMVYGVAYGNATTLNDLNCVVNRYGGNNTSRYNYQVNGDNRGQDWYFESIPEASSSAGERGDTFITMTRGAGAEPMITIPIIGWVAKLGANRSKLASFSIAKYGPQTGNDWQWFPDAGNGIRTTGGYVTGNDPNDANVPNSSGFQQGWINLLKTRGLKYYILDNEHSIWHSTHRDVQPTGATMEQIRDRIIDYAAMTKGSDPNALIVGPEEWGWSGYLFSGYDQQWGSQHGWSNLPDRTAHGGADYMPWLLAQLKQRAQQTGQRPLDIFTLHYYPQGGEFSDDTSSSMQLRRNRSTRSLWDPNYTDETWIADKVQLVPRMKAWVAANYFADVPVGITEYNWGAENHINGATAQADIFGIFGREGLDIGARWTTPDPSTPTYKAMKMYRNYDGAKSAFGDTSVFATVPNPDNVAAFAAQRSSDGALTIMVISKYLSGSTPVTLSLANFSGNGVAERWQLTSTNTITHLSDLSYSGSSISTSVPAQSVTLFVLRTGAPNAPPVASFTATPQSGIAPLAVVFNASGSSDPDGSIASYAWVFGDGTTGSGVNPSHTYANPGTYNATLTVTDNRGATNSTSRVITASADPNAINAPSNLSASGGKGSVVLNWNDNSSNEEGFYIERAPQGSASFQQVGQVGANVRTFSQNLARGNYTFRVRAFNLTTGRVSAYSNSVNVRVK
jgi:PKD repeat protein